MKTRLLLLFLMAITFAKAQINVWETFESGVAPTGWFAGSGTISTTPTSGQACSGSYKLQSSYTSSSTQDYTIFTSNYSSNGQSIFVSFRYKTSGTDNRANVNLFYDVNNSGSWVQLASSSSVATTCSTLYGTIPAGLVPNGALVRFRMQMNVALFVAYFDDFRVLQHLGPQLLANYTFDNTLSDENGSNAFATQAGMTYGTDRSGLVNKALFINGTGTTVSLTNLPVDNSSRTFSFWIKPTQSNGANRIFSYGSPSGTAAYGASFDVSTIYNFSWSSNLPYFHSTSLNVWKHIVCTFEQSTNTASLYIDGVLRAGNDFSCSTANNGILYLGSLFGETGSRYIGYVDDLKIYNDAGTDADVTSLYTNNTLSSSNFTQNNLEVALYPNPVRDILNIEIENDIQSIEIYNIQGQKVLSSNQNQINVSDLASGMYLVRIQDIDNNIATKKIVIK